MISRAAEAQDKLTVSWVKGFYTTEDDAFRLQDDYGRPLESEW